jgi:hypothetical protein
MVEFALTLPLLLVLLLGVADFGRVFAAGITMEAAARNAAEAAAQEYVQLVRNKPGGVLDATDYAHLHQVAVDRVCEESKTLGNHAMSGGSCTMPLAAVCVHDGHDLFGCGVEASGSVPECDALNAPWNDANQGADPDGTGALKYVEVRVCYRFTPVSVPNVQISLPFNAGITLGDVWLERTRMFTVADY